MSDYITLLSGDYFPHEFPINLILRIITALFRGCGYIQYVCDVTKVITSLDQSSCRIKDDSVVLDQLATDGILVMKR